MLQGDAERQAELRAVKKVKSTILGDGLGGGEGETVGLWLVQQNK